MAKESLKARQRKREKLAEKYASKIKALKEIIASGTPEEAFSARMKLQKIPRNAHLVRQRRRCRITGRARGVYRKFGMSRYPIRKYGSLGCIPGLTKASW